MTAFEKYDQPRLKVVVTPNKQALGKTFKRQAKAVQDALEQMQVSCPSPRAADLVMLQISTCFKCCLHSMIIGDEKQCSIKQDCVIGNCTTSMHQSILYTAMPGLSCLDLA